MWDVAGVVKVAERCRRNEGLRDVAGVVKVAGFAGLVKVVGWMLQA